MPHGVVRPHRADAAYCYRMPHVPWSVSVLGRQMSPVKTDEPIEILFWSRIAWDHETDVCVH